MIKRWSAAILTGVMLLSMLFTVSAEDTPKLALKMSSEMIPGSQVTVEVQLENNPGTTGLVLELIYDDALLTLTDVKAGTIAGKSALFIWDKAMPHKVSYADGTGAEGNGTLLTLTFTVAKAAAPGNYSFGVSTTKTEGIENAADLNGEHYSLAPATQNFTVLDYVWGDADGNGVTNIADVQQILKWRVGKDVTLSAKGADADRSGAATLADAILLLQWQADLVEWDPFGDTTPPLEMA